MLINHSPCEEELSTPVVILTTFHISYEIMNAEIKDWWGKLTYAILYFQISFSLFIYVIYLVCISKCFWLIINIASVWEMLEKSSLHGAFLSQTIWNFLWILLTNSSIGATRSLSFPPKCLPNHFRSLWMIPSMSLRLSKISLITLIAWASTSFLHSMQSFITNKVFSSRPKIGHLA